MLLRWKNPYVNHALRHITCLYFQIISYCVIIHENRPATLKTKLNVFSSATAFTVREQVFKRALCQKSTERIHIRTYWNVDRV